MLRDVRGAGRDEEEAVVRWAARALVNAMAAEAGGLAEADADSAAPGAGSARRG